MSKGDVVRLSQLRKGDCGSLKGRRFIVAQWHNGDRISDIAVILFEDDGEQVDYNTDYDRSNPEVVYLGRGSITIDFPKDETLETRGSLQGPVELRDYDFITLCEPHDVVLPNGAEAPKLPAGAKLILCPTGSGGGVGLKYENGSATAGKPSRTPSA